MSIGALTNTNVIREITNLNQQLNQLQEQLSSGEASQTYAGLGSQRAASLNAHTQVQAISAFQQNISTANLRLTTIQSDLTQFGNIASQQQSTNLNSQYLPSDGAQTSQQITAAQGLDQILSIMNQDVAGHFLFSGRDAGQPATLTADQILNGSPPQDGLKAVIAERNQADLGADNLGRLAITSPAAGEVNLSETNFGVFGFKISGVINNLSNASAITSNGPPKSTNFSFSGLPQNGQSVQVALNLPDGTSTTVTLTATTSNPPAAGQFLIGPDAASTATNFQNALNSQLQTTAVTTLKAASSIQAANDFFNVSSTQGPLRVDTSLGPADEATSLRDGTTYGAVGIPATTEAETLGDTGNGADIVAADNTLYSFTVNTGSGPQTVSYTSGTGATQASIVAGLLANFSSTVTGAGTNVQAVASADGKGIRVEALNADANITIGAGAGDSGLTAGSYNSTSLLDNIISAGGAAGDTLNIAVNGGTPQTIIFGTGQGQVSTLAQLNAALGSLNGITASVNGTSLQFLVPGSATQTSLNVTGSSAGLNTALGLSSVSGVTQQGAPPTVVWYTGDKGSTDPRSTTTVNASSSLTLGYGMRATESGFRQIIANLAAFAATDFNPNDPNSAAAYSALSTSVGNNLGNQGAQAMTSVEGEMASTQGILKSTGDNLTNMQTMYQNTISNVESANQEQVATEILNLQTQLQESYQVTANLSKLTLVNFLGG